MAKRTFLCCLLLDSILAPSLLAQNATLRGQVRDESGALVPAAKVTLSISAEPARISIADPKGWYSFESVPPGEYSVQATAPQLIQAQPVDVTLHAGPQTLTLTLKVASVSERVTVEDSAPVLSTDSSSNASAVVLRGSDLDALRRSG
jgi:hypothetical protein